MNSFPEIGEILGKYRLVEHLGHGATARVYKASHTYLNTVVAIKVLSPELIRQDPTIRERFINEAMNHAKLSNSSLVKILDIENDKYTYIVMEYIEGRALDEILNSYGAIPPLKAIKIIKEVCKGLKHSFDLNIVHRDIKPANIMITRDSEVKLADFGLAKNIGNGDENNNQSGVIFGTPYYMSPEQFIHSDNVDHRSDIYSIGATLYHIVTGKLPFDTDSLPEIISMHLKSIPIPPAEINTEITGEFSDLILKLLEKEPNDRFQNYSEILKNLDKIEFTYKSLLFLSHSHEEELSEALSKVRKIEQYQKNFKQYGREEENIELENVDNELRNKVLGNIKKQLNDLSEKPEIDKFVSKNVQKYYKSTESEDDTLDNETEDRLKKKYQKYFKQFNQGMEIEHVVKEEIKTPPVNEYYTEREKGSHHPSPIKPQVEIPVIVKREHIAPTLSNNLNKNLQKFNEENKVKVNASKYIEKFKKLFEK